MNGVALLVALAVAGAEEPQVDYGWRMTEDNQLEYTIQIPLVFLKRVAEGEVIHSPVPPEAALVERLCIRAGNTPLPHTAMSVQRFRELLVSAGRYASRVPAAATDAQVAILWPSTKTPQVTAGLTYGYQPAKDKTSTAEYFAQVDPTVLSQMAVGDELHATIDPAAGAIGTFVISAGNKQLPRVAAAPAATPLSSSRQLGVGNAGATSPLAGASGTDTLNRYGDTQYGVTDTQTTTTATDYSRPPTRFGAPSSSPAASSVRGSAFGTAGQNSYVPPSEPPLLEAPRNGYQGTSPARTDFSDPSQSASNVYPAQQDSRLTDPRYGDSRLADSRTLGGAVPPASSSFGGGSNFDRYREAASAPVGQAAGQAYPPLAHEQPRLPPSTTQYSPPVTDSRLASVPPPVAAPALTGSAAMPPATASAADGKPWVPLMFTATALFLSIGVNLYLGWTTAEYYNRYRLAVDRLRSASRSV